MTKPNERRHLFISHHHQDDSLVEKFNSLLGGKGWDVRNSSIRAKPANEERLKNGLVKDAVLKRLLRMKISWASTVVVLIGEQTHSRPWVNWEIDQAHAQGKAIVGVFEQGGKDADIPKSLEKYASAIVFDFPDSLHTGTTHELKIQYIIENSCGSFVEFEDTVIGDVTEVKIKTLYEGCNCTLEFVEEERFYPIKQDSAGSYVYKFWVSETEFDTYWLEVYQ